MCLFFQAEDGIRYLVRSRGLGDVYKRQLEQLLDSQRIDITTALSIADDIAAGLLAMHDVNSVSYTHLTLPTSDLV